MAASNRTSVALATKATSELASIFDPMAGRTFFNFIASGETADDLISGKGVGGESVIAERIMSVSEGGILTRSALDLSTLQGISPDNVKNTAKSINFVVYDIVKGTANSEGAKLCVPITLDKAVGAQKVNTTTKSTPDVSSVVFMSKHLNLSERDTGAVSVFMNSIPTIEFSRCVPYLDVLIITPGSPKDSGNRPQGISLFRFLNGRTELKNSGDAAFATTYPLDVAQMIKSKTDLDMATTSVTGSSYAGMEVFTSPQTLINADEVYRDFAEIGANPPGAGSSDVRPGMPGSNRSATIIDRMRPFMTLKSFDISVQPTRGTMTTKSAKMSFTLHDRSRLGEISELVKPASFGKTEMLVEWGWSHPDGQNSQNPIGAFLNSLRVKEKYGVYNSSYSFTDDGQVEITVDMVTKGVDSVNWTDVAADDKTKQTWMEIEKLIEAVRTNRVQVLKDEDMKDVAGMSVIASISPSNVADVFSSEKSKEIDEFLQAWKDTKNSTPQISELLKSLGDLKKQVDTQVHTLADSLTNKDKALGNGVDPFFYKTDGSSPTAKTWILPTSTHFIENAKVKENAQKTGADGYVSFGKLMQLYVAEPLATNGNFDEVQLCFYTFNDRAGYYGTTYDREEPLPISCFPIPITTPAKKGFRELFATELKHYVQFPVGRFVNWSTSTYLSSMASAGYGLAKYYTYDDTGKTTTTLKDDKNAPATLKREKDRVLCLAYYGKEVPEDGDEIIFKMPKINMIFEVVPVNASTNSMGGDASEKTILRIHFVDAVAGKYTGVGQILSAAKSSNMGVISKNARGGKIDAEVLKKANAMNLFQLNKENGGYYRIVGGPPQVKYFAKSCMPSITIGTVNSAVTSAGAQSMNDSKDTTIHMLRSQKNSGGPNQAPSDEQDRGLPMRVMPFDISIDTLGCPFLAHTQQFFVDFGTNTSIDNIYAVCGVEHKLEPGSFTTSTKLIPITDAYGTYESTLSVLNKAGVK